MNKIIKALKKHVVKNRRKYLSLVLMYLFFVVITIIFFDKAVAVSVTEMIKSNETIFEYCFFVYLVGITLGITFPEFSEIVSDMFFDFIESKILKNKNKTKNQSNN